MTEKHDARRLTFAHNLKAALQERGRTGSSPDNQGMTVKRESVSQLCRRLGFDESGYLWVRKISSKGISHVRGQRREDLDLLCRELGIDYRTLWDDPKPPSEETVEEVGDKAACVETFISTGPEVGCDPNFGLVAPYHTDWSQVALQGVFDGLVRAIVEKAKQDDQRIEEVLSEFSNFLLDKLRASVERLGESHSGHDETFGERLGEFTCRLGTVPVYKVPKESKAAVRTQFENLHYLSGINASARYYVACFRDEIVAFYATLPLVGRLGNAWRGHRLIVKPEFQGTQVGTRFSEFIAEHYIRTGARFFAKTESPILGEYRNKSPLWRATKTNRKLRVRREQDSYGGINYDSDRVGYSHEYVGTNPRPITVTEPKRFSVPLQKDGVIYLSKPFSLLAKKYMIRKPHVERMIAGIQNHVRGFKLVDEDLRPCAEQMLLQLSHGTLQEISVEDLRSLSQD